MTKVLVAFTPDFRADASYGSAHEALVEHVTGCEVLSKQTRSCVKQALGARACGFAYISDLIVALSYLGWYRLKDTNIWVLDTVDAPRSWPIELEYDSVEGFWSAVLLGAAVAEFPASARIEVEETCGIEHELYNWEYNTETPNFAAFATDDKGPYFEAPLSFATAISLIDIRVGQRTYFHAECFATDIPSFDRK